MLPVLWDVFNLHLFSECFMCNIDTLYGQVLRLPYTLSRSLCHAVGHRLVDSGGGEGVGGSEEEVLKLIIIIKQYSTAHKHLPHQTKTQTPCSPPRPRQNRQDGVHGKSFSPLSKGAGERVGCCAAAGCKGR